MPLAEAVRLIARERFTGQKVPPSARQAVDLWRPFVEEKAAGRFPALTDSLADQDRFARALRDLIAALDIERFDDEPPEENESEEQDDAEGGQSGPQDKSDSSEGGTSAAEGSGDAATGEAEGMAAQDGEDQEGDPTLVPGHWQRGARRSGPPSPGRQGSAQRAAGKALWRL